MLIFDFHARFTSRDETSRLFDVLRRVSRLEGQPFLDAEPAGWPQWPEIICPKVPPPEPA